MKEERIAKLVSFGRGGDTVYLGKGSTISGYGSPERPHAAELKGGLVIPDGTYAVDMRAAVETEPGYHWVFDGPMCNPDLADDAIEECPMPEPIMGAALMESGFGHLLARHVVSRARKQRSGLDMVSIREWVEGWREHGARIGQYHNGVIEWQSDAPGSPQIDERPAVDTVASPTELERS